LTARAQALDDETLKSATESECGQHFWKQRAERRPGL
jgi:hypothetical protein